MSRAALHVWKMVVAAKARAKDQLERELADARREHAALVDAVEHANEGLEAAQAKRTAHESRIERLFSSPTGLSPSTYLDHDRYRGPLGEAVDEARTAVRRAIDAAEAQQRTMERLGQAVRRADASLEAAREQLKRAVAAAERRVEERNDEEAGETAAARLHRGARNV
ncbi:hypothetical protein [Trinickia dinghuensis]|uniref:Type III secretion protein HrpB7 n=1 Tax=Trinickia dinghuensis TaxID=2291023 RepID=A0A3D8K5D7_9BURK|nr:hypothetical protein [Trinickia dinghuensis]RDV00431.1 hypothetical protein DWV00_01170 [Trinickia dinghuensis]